LDFGCQVLLFGHNAICLSAPAEPSRFFAQLLFSIQANFAQQLFAACLAGGFEVFMNI
jgi:hypothetical protein